jgi:hypothetical protein
VNAQILVVTPGTLTDADKALLRESGVVCVEAADPSSVRFLAAESPAIGCNDLFYAAMQAIASDRYGSNTAEHFAKTVAVLVKASVVMPERKK